MDELNKNQIVLLTLFVSFITSIATGIFTITLMDQAPVEITHTISKVIEKTVERVAPSDTQPAVVTKTIIIREENQIAEAVEKNLASLVKVKTKIVVNEDEDKKGNELPEGKTLGLGFILTDEGHIITDSNLVVANTIYSVVLSNGDIFDVEVLSQDEEIGLAVMKIIYDDSEKIPVLTSVEIVGVNDLSLGQTIVALTGLKDLSIKTGIITGFGKEIIVVGEGEDEKEIKQINIIQNNINLGQNGTGGILIDVDGYVVGINIIREGKLSSVPIYFAKEMILEGRQSSIEETQSSIDA